MSQAPQSSPPADFSNLRSMTAFAARRGWGEGALEGYAWAWELRSVNGKGLDLRLRLPEGLEAIEQPLRALIGARIQRGNLSLSLKLGRDSAGETLRLQPEMLEAALGVLAAVEARARARKFALGAVTAADILAMRGVLDTRRGDDEIPAELLPSLLYDAEALVADFDAMRAQEGAALGAVILGQIENAAGLVAQARPEAEARRAKMGETLSENLKRALGAVEADPARVAQELALLAVKADVTEEIDRLVAHVGAAHALLAAPGPVGRKFDFLTQEFNREANTLCSKAQALRLTQIGLDLKHVIDQMREQVQNLE